MCVRPGVLLGSIVLLVLASPAVAAAGPGAGEFLVAQTVDSGQANPVAAFGPAGGSLVVWEDSRYGVRGQRYDETGAETGAVLDLAPTRMPATIPGEGHSAFAREPSVAFLPNGDFVLAWAEERGYLRVEPFYHRFDLESRRVMARRFRPSGEPAGPAFQVSTLGAGEESWPKLQAIAGGGLLAVWRSEGSMAAGGPTNGLFARRLTRGARPVGPEVRLSRPGDREAQNPALAEGAGGQILIAWEGCCDAGGDLGIFARIYDASTRTFGSLVRLNGDQAGRQRRPALAPAGESGFFALWQSELERSLIPIFGRFFDLAARPAGGEHLVSRGSGTVQLAPGLSPAPGGGYLAVWRDWLEYDFGITAVELDAAGLPRGEHARVNADPVRRSAHTSIATDGAGRFLIPWEKYVGRRQVIGARWLESEAPAPSARSVGLGVMP